MQQPHRVAAPVREEGAVAITQGGRALARVHRRVAHAAHVLADVVVVRRAHEQSIVVGAGVGLGLGIGLGAGVVGLGLGACVPALIDDTERPVISTPEAAASVEIAVSRSLALTEETALAASPRPSTRSS